MFTNHLCSRTLKQKHTRHKNKTSTQRYPRTQTKHTTGKKGTNTSNKSPNLKNTIEHNRKKTSADFIPQRRRRQSGRERVAWLSPCALVIVNCYAPRTQPSGSALDADFRFQAPACVFLDHYLSYQRSLFFSLADSFFFS